MQRPHEEVDDDVVGVGVDQDEDVEVGDHEEQLEGDALEWRGGARPPGHEDVHVVQYLEEEEEEEEHVEEELDDLVSPLVEKKGEEGCLTIKKTRKRSQVHQTTVVTTRCSYSKYFQHTFIEITVLSMNWTIFVAIFQIIIMMTRRRV